jgi:hypothetical protein
MATTRNQYESAIGANFWFVVVTSDPSYTILQSDRFIHADPTAAPVSLTLPAAPVRGEVHYINDSTGQSATNPITINGNGQTINGLQLLVLNATNAAVLLEYNGTSWSAFGTGNFPGFSDNAVAQRTFQRKWMKRDEYPSSGSGEGGASKVFDPTVTNNNTAISPPAPRVTDNGAQLAANSIAVLADKMFYAGKDTSSNVPGTLYGLDLLTLTTTTGISVAGIFVSNVTNDGGGQCEITTSAPHGLKSNWTVTVTGVLGATGTTGHFPIFVIDATHFSLTGSTFGGAYTSGGLVTFTFPLNVYSAGFAINAVTNNGGLIQIHTTQVNTLATGNSVIIAFVNGVPANGTWTITVIDNHNFTLNGSSFSGAYLNFGNVYLATGDNPNELIGVRGNSFTPQDYLWAGGTVNIELGTISTSGSYGLVYRTAVAAGVVRACYLNGGALNDGTFPRFAFTATDGNVYIADQNGAVHLALSPAGGSSPGAILADDNGYVWISYTGTNPNKIVQCLVNYGTNTLTVLNTINTPLAAPAVPITDLVVDGRYVWALGQQAADPIVYSYDLNSKLPGPTINMGVLTLSPSGRLASDGLNLYVNTGAQVNYADPMTGEILASDPLGGTAYRGIVVDSSGTMIVTAYANSTSKATFAFASTNFKDANFNSIRLMGRPLSFLNGGRMQGILQVSPATTGQLDIQHNFAACNTTTGSPTVFLPSTGSLPDGWMAGVWDNTDNAATHPITVNPNAVNIEDPNNPGVFAGSTITLSRNGTAVLWIWSATLGAWKVFSYAGPIPVGAGGAPTNRVTWGLLMGSPASTGVGSSTPQIVGSNYFDIQTLQTATGGFTREVFFKFILSTTNASDVANIDLIDVNNVLGGGAGAEVTGSNFTTTNTTPTYFTQRITALEPLVTGGIFQVRIWLNPQAAGQQVTCYMAKLDVEYH